MDILLNSLFQYEMAALEMPVRALTLYNNGYGVFQRNVNVKGRGHIDLYFEAKDMEYVLKSLSFTDETGSSLGNISYEPTRPEATFSVEESESILGLMKSLQGFTVAVKLVSGEEIEGRLLGIDNLEVRELISNSMRSYTVKPPKVNISKI